MRGQRTLILLYSCSALSYVLILSHSLLPHDESPRLQNEVVCRVLEEHGVNTRLGAKKHHSWCAHRPIFLSILFFFGILRRPVPSAGSRNTLRKAQCLYDANVVATFCVEREFCHDVDPCLSRPPTSVCLQARCILAWLSGVGPTL